MTGTKVGTVEEDEVTDNATMVRFYFQFHVKKKNLYFHEILELIFFHEMFVTGKNASLSSKTK